MVKLLSTLNLILLFSIFLVVVSSEKQRDEDNFGNQGNIDFGQFPGRNDNLMEPNLFQKIGTHLVKGWHGFRGLFGRKSNRREENLYGNGAFGPENKKPFEKETDLNKGYPETNYNNYGGNNQNQNQFQQGGQKGDQENNQNFRVEVDERFKGNKGQKEVYGIEESTGKPFDGRKEENKDKSKEKKSPETVNGFETELGNQNLPGEKQRSRRDLRGFRPPFGRPFRQPFRSPFRRPFPRGPFRGPFRRPY